MAPEGERKSGDSQPTRKLSARLPTDLTAGQSRSDESPEQQQHDEIIMDPTILYTNPNSQNSAKITRRCRNSRFLSLVLGVSTLAVIAYGIIVLLDHQGIHFRTSSPDFETLRSLETVRLHDEPEDCWMILDGTVYDLTEYDHPGGMAYIYGRCGRDGTSGFDNSHSRHYIPLISEFARGKVEITASPSVAPIPAPVSVPVSIPTPVVVAQPMATIPESPAPTESPVPFCISIEQVRQHNVPEDCYYILYGDVFDFTLYIDEHPGGPKHIEDECGTDATVMFETAKKHDMSLLQKKKGYDYHLGPAC